MNITVIGTGYVGLVTGACFAETGNNVTCLDIDSERINKLLKGEIPFFEPGLTDLVRRNLDSGRITFTDSYEQGTKNSIFFLCVGTPDKGDGKTDLSNLKSVITSLANNIQEKSYIYTKSTVPLGTNNMISSYFDSVLGKNKVLVASNPEFLKEGSAVIDFQKPDRIIVGTSSDESRRVATDLYLPFNWSKSRMLFMSVDSAELTKYAANSLLATKISFMNEMSLICDKSKANIHEVRKGIGSDPRIGDSFLYAGLGYGGSCFPKDVNALMNTQKDLGLESGILERTKFVNERQVKFFFNKIVENINGNINSKTMTIWGLSFKPNSDDVRESVSLELIKLLSGKVKSLNLYDPIATDSAKKELRGINNLNFFKDKYEAVIDSDALILCTEWKEFWDIDVLKLELMLNKVIFDGRNILNKTKIENSGIEYHGIGT